MRTLTETAYLARKGIRFGGIGFVAITILWFVGVGFVNWWKITHPAPLPPATADFGPLPAIKFPKSKYEKLEYNLQTPTGKLGEFPDRMWVFFAQNKRSAFGDTDKAIDTARRLGFLGEETAITSSLYRFTNNDPLPSTLEVDIISGDFSLKRQWQADPSLLVLKRFSSDKQAVTDAQTFLRSKGLLQDDLAGNEKVSYWRVQGDKLIPAISLSESEFVKVDFFRKNYDEIDANKQVLATYSFYTPTPQNGLVSVLLSSSPDEKNRAIEVSYKYVDVDYDSRSEYPLKTVELAYDELKNNQGYVASFDGVGSVDIRRITLGYFDTMGSQQYAMPIYVFTGDNNFVAYVSATSGEQIQP